jgi:quercetin dioxygenase-like cupin family protein
MKCKVYGPRSHYDHSVGAGGSNCFYFPVLALDDLARVCGEQLVARAARIEVTDDANAPLHKHKGATIVFIVAGSGTFRTENNVHQLVEAGYTVYVPPMTAHLSVAADNTTMIEWVVYLGHKEDMQESVPA